MNVFIFGLGLSARNHIKTLLNYEFIAKIFVFTDHPIKFPLQRVSCVHRSAFNSVASNNIPDLILIASSTSSHIGDFSLVSHLNVPTIFEKPVSGNLQDTYKIISNCNTQSSLYVFFQRRLSPEFQALLAVKNSGLLGKPNSVLCQLSKYKSKNGYGYLSHYGIHYIDLFFRLLDIYSYNISSFIADFPGNEKLAAISGLCNSSIYLSLLLDCSSKYSCSSSMSIQFEHASIKISDSNVSVLSSDEVANYYNSLLQVNPNIAPKNKTNLGDYANFWSYFLRQLISNDLPDNIPTVDESFAVEKFIQACYSCQQ